MSRGLFGEIPAELNTIAQYKPRNNTEITEKINVVNPSPGLLATLSPQGRGLQDALLGEPAVAPGTASDSLRSPRLASNLGHPEGHGSAGAIALPEYSGHPEVTHWQSQWHTEGEML